VTYQDERPAAPFRPTTFIVVGPTRDTTATRPRGPIYGSEQLGPDGRDLLDGKGRRVREVVGWKHPGKSRPCWDLSIRSDGFRWEDRYYAAGIAQSVKEELESGFRQGLIFDPGSRRFLSPTTAAQTAPTVFSEAMAWWRAHWSTVEPKSRQETLRYISRPIRELVRAAHQAPEGIDEYLLWQMLPPKPPDKEIPAEHQAPATWLREASLPISTVDTAVWQAYVDRWRINSRTGRPVAQASLNRHLADVKQMWAWVCAVHRLNNPWQMIKTSSRSSTGGRRSTTVRPVDRTIVLSPEHVRELGRLCGESSFGPPAEVYILLLGIAGGRPGESAGVQRSEITVAGQGMGRVRFSRTHRRGIDPSFLDSDDDTDWGPLKGREIEEARTAPLPSCDATRINHLLRQAPADGPLFLGWDWEKFRVDVWIPAKTEMAARYADRYRVSKIDKPETDALVSALYRLRLHDLRHAACSMWLNTPGVEVRVACEWSGHKRLSVFLDIYQGIMPGSHTSAEGKLDAAWGHPEG
jgi:integrase